MAKRRVPLVELRTIDRAVRRPPRSTYPQVAEGQWHVPPRRNFRAACCDCGLVHRVNFRIVRGRLEFQVFRDERATAQVRRAKRRRREMVE